MPSAFGSAVEMLNTCYRLAFFPAKPAAMRHSRYAAVRRYVAEILRKAAEEHRMEMNNFASMEATMCLKLHAAEAERSSLEEKVRRMEVKVGQLKAAATADRDAAAVAYVAQAAELADARYQNEQLSTVRPQNQIAHKELCLPLACFAAIK